MIKDFDLVITKLDTTQNALSVTNFESYDEAVWYLNSISTDALLTQIQTDYKVQKVIISEGNYALVKVSYGLNDYLEFLRKNLENRSNVQLKSSKKQEAFVNVKENKSKQAELLTERSDVKAEHKQQDKLDDELAEKTTKNSVNSLKLEIAKGTTLVTEALQKQESTKKEASINTLAQPKQDDVPLFKGLFSYKANDPHFIAIYIASGTIDFAKIKTTFDDYNAKNYGVMNLKVTLETTGKQQTIIIGSLSDAQVAKSYLLRMVKEKSLFEGLKGSNYRNLLGSQKNLNTVIQKNELKTYFEFMQEYYLK